MADWENLRELTQQVVPPDFGSLERTATRRRRRSRVAVGVFAALVLVGGGVGIAALDDDPGQAPLQPVEDPSGPTVPDPGSVRDLPDAPPGQRAVELDGGRYEIPLTDTLAFDIDVPDMTTAHDDGMFLATRDFIVKTEAAPEGYGVPAHPCTEHRIEPVGPTVDDLVGALDELPVYRTTRPEPVRLGGGEGFYIEARVPRAYDASRCEGRGEVELPGNPETVVAGPPPYVGRWWILDVAGQRVVVQQNCWGCTFDQLLGTPSYPESITFTSLP
jgi:hypothetical protein